MIRYLKNEEIERERWDKVIGDSGKVIPYGFSWYLDIMSPGWAALVDEDYKSVFPLPVKKKYGIYYVATPNFLQRLGLFYPSGQSTDKVDTYLRIIPGIFKLVDLRINQPAVCEGFITEERTNFELRLSEPYENLRQSFSDWCKKNIEKSYMDRHDLTSDVSPAELTDLFRKNKGMDINGIKSSDYDRLNELIDYCYRYKKGKIFGIRSHEKKLIFGRFFLTTPGRITMLFAANTNEGREKKLSFYVMNEIIKEYSSTDTILDFEGSSIPSIAAFMKSFGCTGVPYYRIYSNRLPWPIRMLKPF